MHKSVPHINGVLLEVFTNSIVIISQKKNIYIYIYSMYLGQDF